MTYKPFKMKGSPMHRNFGIGAQNIRGEGRSERLQRKIEEAEKGGDSKRADRLKNRERRLMDRFQRRAARLEQRGKLDKAERIRNIEKDIYKKALERDIPGTEQEIASDMMWEYDPSGRRMTAGRRNRLRRRDRLVSDLFDLEGQEDDLITAGILKKGKSKKYKK
jgi:hypothetical protein